MPEQTLALPSACHWVWTGAGHQPPRARRALGRSLLPADLTGPAPDPACSWPSAQADSAGWRVGRLAGRWMGRRHDAVSDRRMARPSPASAQGQGQDLVTLAGRRASAGEAGGGQPGQPGSAGRDMQWRHMQTAAPPPPDQRSLPTPARRL